MIKTFHNSCMRRIMGYRGLGGPSTAELLCVTGQVPITKVLSHYRVRWLGHAARKPKTTMVKQHLLFADSTPGRPRPRPPSLHVDGWGHAGPQHPRAPATAGPSPRLAEAGA